MGASFKPTPCSYDVMIDRKTVISVYNRYLTRGGEDEVFESECRLLAENGWNVVPVTTTTTSPTGIAQGLKLGFEATWSRKWHKEFGRLVEREKPALVHVHNLFPVMSPSILHAARSAGAAVVHTLHNYRLVCPNAICYRSDRPCEDCVGRSVPWPGVLHACYRGSHAQSAGVAAMLTFHRMAKTWERQVDRFVTLSRFARDLLTRGGLPEDKVVVKPNFVHPDPGPRQHGGSYCLFVGRLASQKGAWTMLRAWKGLQGIPLKVVGDPTTEQEARRMEEFGGAPGIELLGRKSREEVLSLMKGARFLVFPSQWYETFGLGIVEAFACGVPVLASDLGAMPELVEDGVTGLLFTPGSDRDLAEKAVWMWAHQDEVATMGTRARAEFVSKYTAERNYELIEDIYEQAVQASKHS
jgi:glycosyltransferase involved in cell wall biosynthesis